MNAPQPGLQPKRLSLNGAVRWIKNSWREDGLLLLAAVLIVTTDQVAKVKVRENIPLGGAWLPAPLAWLMPYARIRYWYNSGAAFNIFQNGNLVFMALAILVAGAILIYFPRISRKEGWLRLALALLFSGAVGNLADRIQFGHVTDFISVGNFAIFNIADACISIGVVVLVLRLWMIERADKRRAAAASAPDDDKGKGA